MKVSLVASAAALLATTLASPVDIVKRKDDRDASSTVADPTAVTQTTASLPWYPIGPESLPYAPTTDSRVASSTPSTRSTTDVSPVDTSSSPSFTATNESFSGTGGSTTPVPVTIQTVTITLNSSTPVFSGTGYTPWSHPTRSGHGTGLSSSSSSSPIYTNSSASFTPGSPTSLTGTGVYTTNLTTVVTIPVTETITVHRSWPHSTGSAVSSGPVKSSNSTTQPIVTSVPTNANLSSTQSTGHSYANSTASSPVSTSNATSASLYSTTCTDESSSSTIYLTSTLTSTKNITVSSISSRPGTGVTPSSSKSTVTASNSTSVTGTGKHTRSSPSAPVSTSPTGHVHGPRPHRTLTSSPSGSTPSSPVSASNSTSSGHATSTGALSYPPSPYNWTSIYTPSTSSLNTGVPPVTNITSKSPVSTSSGPYSGSSVIPSSSTVDLTITVTVPSSSIVSSSSGSRFVPNSTETLTLTKTIPVSSVTPPSSSNTLSSPVSTGNSSSSSLSTETLTSTETYPFPSYSPYTPFTGTGTGVISFTHPGTAVSSSLASPVSTGSSGFVTTTSPTSSAYAYPWPPSRYPATYGPRGEYTPAMDGSTNWWFSNWFKHLNGRD